MIVAAAVLALVLAAGEVAAPPDPPRLVARGVTELPGAVPEDRGPDGNTVIFEAPQGLVVVDTGRHVWKSDQILAFARESRRPIAAIINTHWHLDHTSGNRRIKAVFPNAPIYATSAIDRALGPDGFLTRNLANARAHANDPGKSDVEREETAGFIATMDAAQSLRPDIVVSRDGRMRIAGKRLDVHVTNGAVTDADIWLYDRDTHVAVVGDLVTFPAPFFETACPQRWSEALDAVWATPFVIAVPGHGLPMSREEFDAYRQAYNMFIACVRGDAESRVCATVWADAIATFVPDNTTRDAALAYADYYVGFLREHGGKSAACLADG
ncbi:MAG TPA: MBL fold metallo-hydrolase [Caulobacterales bacterium]|nr:MBL fold metallo-hydrolase [Caulobacterales bacterium]